MDDRRFDDLVKSLAAPHSRRGILRGLSALAAGLAGYGAGAQAASAQCGNTSCRSNPSRCGDGCVCCVWANGNSRCRPSGQCSGTVVTPGATTTTTTTTTTTAAPTLQGTCPSGANRCSGYTAGCNNTIGCNCGTTTSGATVCYVAGSCRDCSTDADCVATDGQGAMCFQGALTNGCGCLNFCARACPSGE